jgi:vitamin B12/bleomycin/antimicrobial peptide transport system ATP-binding/permease protein
LRRSSITIRPLWCRRPQSKTESVPARRISLPYCCVLTGQDTPNLLARRFIQQAKHRPARAYVPVGTLRRAATYPEPPESKSVEEVTRVLKLVGLGHLVDQIEADNPWEQTLSGGEKQRLAFARILLQRPDIVVLDEATSALDPKSQDELMRILTEELQPTTIVSVAHRPELEAFHSRKVVLERRRGGARFVRDVHLTPRPRRRDAVRSWLRRRRSSTRKRRAA